MREMILADDEAGRRAALAKLLPFQREDFVGIFEAMDGLPVTIRLLDPPLHEFLPHDGRARSPRSPRRIGVSPDEGAAPRVERAARVQPDARLPRLPPADRLPRDRRDAGPRHHRGGHRGGARTGEPVLPEIMIPLVGAARSSTSSRRASIAVAEAVMKKAGAKVDYLIGTMIEVPRAALAADEIAERPSSSPSAPTT